MYLTLKNREEAKIMAEANQAHTIATNMAGRSADIKLGGNKDFIEDDVIDEDEHKKNELRVKELGGLPIIGAERHEN